MSERDDFRNECSACWVCGADFCPSGFDVHEIARGVHRKQALEHRCCWIFTCRDCHSSQLGSYDFWDPTMQLALKMIRDPEHYDRIADNRIRSRADDAISERDVALAVAVLFKRER